MKQIFVACILAVAACKSGGAGGGTKGPGVGKSKTGNTKAAAISQDTREDFGKAAAYYREQDKGTWTADACEKAASMFNSVADDHKGLVEARYMAGRSYQNCGMSGQAESAFRKALKKSPGHTRSLSMLGQIAFDKGDRKGAEKMWREALAKDAKLAGAHNNIAVLLLADMKNVEPWSDKWKELQKDAMNHLTQSLAVDSDNVKTYVLYAHVYMEGYQKNKSRLDLAQLLLDEGKKQKGGPEFPELHNAYGLLALHRDDLGGALRSFKKAVELNKDYAEAHKNVAFITLKFRDYASAEREFSEVLRLTPKDYEARVGLGYAQRGLGKFDEAEATYKAAIQLNGSKGAAFFNMGVLYKDFKGAREQDLKKSQEFFETAKDYFRKFLTKKDVSKSEGEEAQANIKDLDKVIQQLEQIIKMQAQANAGADASATPAPAPAPPPPSAKPAPKATTPATES